MLYLHHAVLPRVLTADFTPDLTLTTVVYFALAAGGVASIVVGFLLGFLSDLFGWGPVGLGALVATLAAAVYGRFRVQIYERSLLVPAVLTTFAALVKQILYFALLAFGPAHVNFGWSIVWRLVVGTVVTGLVAFPVFYVYWRLIPPRRR